MQRRKRRKYPLDLSSALGGSTQTASVRFGNRATMRAAAAVRSTDGPVLSLSRPEARREMMAPQRGCTCVRAVSICYGVASRVRTRAHLDRLDVLEVTADHCHAAQRSAIFDLAGRIPLTTHGVGLSIGTDAPIDLAYLDEVATVVTGLKTPAYSDRLSLRQTPAAIVLERDGRLDVGDESLDDIARIRKRLPSHQHGHAHAPLAARSAG